MRTRKSRYQQGSISKLQRASGSVWQVRFSEVKDGKRYQRTQIFDCYEYPTEKSVRKAIELTVSQINSGTGGEKADSRFCAVVAIYRSKHLPTLQWSAHQTNEYLLRKYIEPRFAQTPIREMKPLVIDDWIQALPLNPTTKRNIRSVMKVCFRFAALHEFMPPESNPMGLIKIKGASSGKRIKKIVQISVADFKRLLKHLPQPLDVMVMVAAAYGLRISELVALKWVDIDEEAKTLSIVRKFTHGRLGETKTAASEAPLPLSKPLLKILKDYKPKTNGSEWLFPLPGNGRTAFRVDVAW